MANNYWANRVEKTQDILFRKHRKEIDKKMRQYYQKAIEQTIADYEATYDHLMTMNLQGKAPTPADLYKLDKYWKMRSQLEKRLTNLGKRQISLLNKAFKETFWASYNMLGIPSLPTYSTIDDGAVEQLIKQIWCADGKSWSTRIWENTNLLKQTLEEGLLNTVATGKPTSYLKKQLMERFNVSFSRADALVRTELAHVQTQAAQQRYKDYGLEEVEILVTKDERLCPICSKQNGKRLPINAKMPIPFHPRCRCCVVPVVNIPEEK